jgi:hypothetical protein
MRTWNVDAIDAGRTFIVRKVAQNLDIVFARVTVNKDT